jgi:hypothetical protein
MSGSNPPGRVVELTHAHRIAAGKLLAIVRGAMSKRIGALVNSLYEGVDDALFDLAERAANNANQARYFDGMREIRKKRQSAETRFLELANRNCSEFEAGKLAPTKAEYASGGSASTGNLSLVDEGELEETLAIGAMVDKAELRLQRILYPLEQRFSVLAGNRVVDGGNNPIGPKLLCQVFAESIREFDVEVEVRLIVLKLFERHVLANIDPVYDEVNALLVQAGVLTNLRYQVPGRERREAAAPRLRAAAESLPERAIREAGRLDHDPDGERSEVEIANLVTELRGLLAQRRSHHAGPAPSWIAPAGGAGTAAPSRMLGSQELLNALTLMQSELESQVPSAPANEVMPTTAAGQVKQHLIDQVRRLGMTGSQPPQFGADEDTIDLVGMLFEYALQDRNLPAPIQAMLGRLQIPYLKVALLDRDFVAHKSHPARRLLDNLAQACVGWSEDSDKDQRLYGKAHDIVVTLLKEFDDDISIFERLNADFEEFVDKNRRRAELTERRTTEIARGRERLDGAQRAAAREILSQIGGRNLPANVRDLLTRRWSNYLVLTHLRHGEQSPEWRSAARFIEDFSWSVQPMHDDQERTRLREMTPELERMLRSGLAATGLHEGYLDELWGEVRGIYEQQIAGQPIAESAPAADAPVDADALRIRFASSRSGEEVVFDAATTRDQAVVSDEVSVQALETWMRIARALKTGTWFEFVKDDGTRERAKLLWISTIRALYLFVNRNGIKIAEKTATELADELKSQRTVVLEQVALVDRALDAILQRLRAPGAESATSEPAGIPAVAVPPATATVPPTRH